MTFTPSPEPIRAALFGYGLGGRLFHAPFLRTVPGLQLDAVVTSNPDRVAAVGAETGAPVIATADEVWQRANEFDLAVISTGNAAHVELAEAALDHGLHVVVDKPLCADAPTARVLAARAAERDRLLVTYQNRRYDGDFLTLQRLVADGQLGSLHRLESRFERWRPVPKGGWRESADPRDLGGLLYDLGAHLLDQALVLLGPAASVYAEVAARRAGEAVDDDVFVAITHTSGAISHHWASVLAAEPGPRFRALGSRGSYTVWGLDPQEDALRADPTDLPTLDSGRAWGVRGSDADGTLANDNGVVPVVSEPGDYRQFWVQLVAALRDGAPSPVPIEQTIAVMELLDAARRSGATGLVVPVG